MGVISSQRDTRLAGPQAYSFAVNCRPTPVAADAGYAPSKPMLRRRKAVLIVFTAHIGRVTTTFP